MKHDRLPFVKVCMSLVLEQLSAHITAILTKQCVADRLGPGTQAAVLINNNHAANFTVNTTLPV